MPPNLSWLVPLLGFILVAYTLSAFFTDIHILIYGYVLVTLAVIGMYSYLCLQITQIGIGACQAYSVVVQDVSYACAMVTITWVFSFPARHVVKRMVGRV